jgi:Icc-related predicted phosphoesterase
MRAWILSDLHIEDLDHHVDGIPSVDIALIAGDVVAPISRSMRWLNREIAATGMPVIYVAGNHDNFGSELIEAQADARNARSKYPGVHFLENETIVIGSSRFLGCTLWTDFAINGDQSQAMEVAQRHWNDYQLIDLEVDGDWRLIQPQDTLKVHRDSRLWLERQLAIPFDGKTVVVTHHAPHPRSIHPSRVRDPLTPVFVSDLTTIIDTYQPDLWVHGHMHHSSDYAVGETRIICNPRGKVRRSFYGTETENPAFNPALVINI